jgi:ribose transport system permease protein
MRAKLEQNILIPTYFVLVFLVVSVFYAPDFLSSSSLVNILQSTAALLPAVLGMQALMIAGKVDLSVGATASLSGVVTGLTLLKFSSVSFAVFSGLGVAVLAGVIAGLLETKLRIPSLITTLAMMGLIRSLALILADGKTVSGFLRRIQITVNYYGSDNLVLCIISLALLLASVFAMDRIHYFRNLYLVGSNSVAARALMVPVDRTIILGFVLSSLGAGICGVFQTARSMSASPIIFHDLALDSIAACILGGGSLSGGRGSMIGAAIGLTLVVATRNLVVAMEVSVYWRYFIVGVLVLIAGYFGREKSE